MSYSDTNECDSEGKKATEAWERKCAVDQLDKILKAIAACKEDTFDLSRYTNPPLQRPTRRYKEGEKPNYTTHDFELIKSAILAKKNISHIIPGNHGTIICRSEQSGYPPYENVSTESDSEDGIEAFLDSEFQDNLPILRRNEQKEQEAIDQHAKILKDIKACKGPTFDLSQYTHPPLRFYTKSCASSGKILYKKADLKEIETAILTNKDITFVKTGVHSTSKDTKDGIECFLGQKFMGKLKHERLMDDLTKSVPETSRSSSPVQRQCNVAPEDCLKGLEISLSISSQQKNQGFFSPPLSFEGTFTYAKDLIEKGDFDAGKRWMMSLASANHKEALEYCNHSWPGEMGTCVQAEVSACRK